MKWIYEKAGIVGTGVCCAAVLAALFWPEYKPNSNPITTVIHAQLVDVNNDGQLENIVELTNPLTSKVENLLAVECDGQIELVRYSILDRKIVYNDNGCRNY